MQWLLRTRHNVLTDQSTYQQIPALKDLGTAHRVVNNRQTDGRTGLLGWGLRSLWAGPSGNSPAPIPSWETMRVPHLPPARRPATMTATSQACKDRCDLVYTGRAGCRSGP